MHRQQLLKITLAAILLLWFNTRSIWAGGEPRPYVGAEQTYQPIHQRLPVGRAAYLKTFGNQPPVVPAFQPPYFQPVRISLPSTGKVRVYHSRGAQVDFAGNEQVGLLVGFYYRLRIDSMPEFPGIQLYPTVEMLDRLHPPAGRAQEFPVPVEFSKAEIETALAGGLVTKVVYLEQPDRAKPEAQGRVILGQTVPASTNTLAESDENGRPMAIVRLGGRTPTVNPDPQFFGVGVPAQPLPAVKVPAPASR